MKQNKNQTVLYDMFATNSKKDLSANTVDKTLDWDYTTFFPHTAAKSKLELPHTSTGRGSP